MPISLIAVVAAVVALAALYGPRLAGQFMAWQETQRLRKAGADLNHINPPAHSENFEGMLAPVWAFNIINGADQIGRAPEFHNSSIEMNHGLVIAQHFDPNFERLTKQQYNNASLIGLDRKSVV